MKMEALTTHTFDGNAYTAGDTYEADEQYVETLTVLRFAKVAGGPADKAVAPKTDHAPGKAKR